MKNEEQKIREWLETINCVACSLTIALKKEAEHYHNFIVHIYKVKTCGDYGSGNTLEEVQKSVQECENKRVANDLEKLKELQDSYGTKTVQHPDSKSI